jgi:hypothetical protein
LFKFHAYLFDYLLTLSNVQLGIIARKTLASPADRETLVIEETSDLANNQNILTLIIASITSALHRFQLWELLLPIPKYMRLDRTKVADFTYREIALTRYWRKFVVIPRFQHMLLLGPLVFVLAGRSPLGER